MLVSAVYFIFRHNQLSLHINLVCFDSISAKDYLVQLSGTVRQAFPPRSSGVWAQKKRTSDQHLNETFNGKALKHMQICTFVIVNKCSVL